MRVYLLSWFHLFIFFASVYLAFHRLTSILSLESRFPEDILDEISDIRFEKFNNLSGSHLTLVPGIAHYFLFNETTIDFITAVSIKSALMIGNMDVVFLHTLDANLTGRHFDSLMDDPFFKLGENVMLSIFDSNSTLLSSCKTDKERLHTAQLLMLSEVGGVLLPKHSLALRPLQPLLTSEARVRWNQDQSWDQTVLMVHKRARLLQLAAKAKKEKQIENPLDWVLRSKRLVDEGLVTWDEGKIGELPKQLFEVYQHYLVLVTDQLNSDGPLLVGSNTLNHLLRIIWMR